MQKKGKTGNGRARNAITVPDEPVKIDAERMEQVALWESVGGPPPADDVLFVV